MNKHFFELAKEESYRSTYSGRPATRTGCVVVYHGTILAKGSNSNKGHPIQKKYNKFRYSDSEIEHYCVPSLHAEIQALKKIRYLDIDMSKVQVYTYRQLSNGKLAMSRPCPSCMQYIKSLNIKQLNYTTDDGYATEYLEK